MKMKSLLGTGRPASPRSAGLLTERLQRLPYTKKDAQVCAPVRSSQEKCGPGADIALPVVANVDNALTRKEEAMSMFARTRHQLASRVSAHGDAGDNPSCSGATFNVGKHLPPDEVNARIRDFNRAPSDKTGCYHKRLN